MLQYENNVELKTTVAKGFFFIHTIVMFFSL